MPLLRVPGVFVAPVPDGWDVVEAAGPTYVLTPPDSPRAEMRITVFERPPGPLGEREGGDRLLELLAELGVDSSDDEIAYAARYTPGAHRAFAWFPARDAAGREVDCLAAVVVFPRAVVAATATASVRAPAPLSAAEVLLASLTPDTPARAT